MQNQVLEQALYRDKWKYKKNSKLYHKFFHERIFIYDLIAVCISKYHSPKL